MTLFKLSLRNARRQAKDYLVYFVTTVMVAALIYAFNGLIFSQEIHSLSQRLQSMILTIVLASIVVICIIRWLVSYTTNFMLTRRSRELGTYLLIGLENRQVAQMFFWENLIVGGVAMVLGIFIGNLLFQVLRAVMLALFQIPYRFGLSFSIKAVVLTLFYFILIYLLAQCKSGKRIHSMNIYDLIYFERQNENAVIQSSAKRRRIFVLSIVFGIIGTMLIMMGELMIGIIGAGLIIAFLYGFFASFSSGVPVWFERHTAKKYQGQNLLVFRTLCAKLATMGVVMATIALLFTATIISEGAGMTFRAMFVNRYKEMECFDVMFSSENPENEVYQKCLEYIQTSLPIETFRQYPIYLSDCAELTDYLKSNMRYYEYYPTDALMRASDYTALREMLGYPAVSLAEGTYLVHCEPHIGQTLKNWSKPLTIGGQTLAFADVHMENFAQYLGDFNGEGFLLIVPDEAVWACPINHTVCAVKTQERLVEAQYDALYAIYRNSDSPYRDLDCLHIKSATEASVAADTAMIVFPLYYLALVLIMTAATILTIQQLSEMQRYKQQFTLLRKLGMDRREMAKVLRTQFAIYYTMPAIPPVLIGTAFIVNMGNAVEPGTLTGVSCPFVIAGGALVLFFIIYAIYILLAYTTLKRNVLPE